MWYSFLAKLLSTNQAFAQGTGDPGGGGGINLTNPLGSGTTINDVLLNIISGLRKISLPIAIIMILVAAFLFLTAGSSEDRIKLAKKTLLYAVIGYGIILWAEGIALIIKQVITGGA